MKMSDTPRPSREQVCAVKEIARANWGRDIQRMELPTTFVWWLANDAMDWREVEEGTPEK